MRKSVTRRQFLGELVAVTGGLALVSVVGGCTPKPAAAPTEAPKQAPAAQPTAAPKKAEEKISLRVQVEGGPLGAQMGQLCDEYNKMHPNIAAKVEEVP